MFNWGINYQPYPVQYTEEAYGFSVDAKIITRLPVHPSKLPGSYKCPNCGKNYRYLRNMQNHVKVECGQEPKIRCPHCEYRTKYKSSLQKHMIRKHSHTRKRNQ
ncbi:longitudinals lacking protein, isoforms A/B/D/L-like [Leptopilina boulardi]|uniref:longitudinals lacking protein, isoforms A/B/D/L-like n=1 Tax=Leptopilina boulardi TaxID=63433 RepID=UPI0021F67DE6|nr:longitudinals lacking protein, isoforms A/B/D/L-like [Leptopilina boulardi]